MAEDLAKERVKQVEEMADWATKNTDYSNITPEDAVKFFDGDKENLAIDLRPVSKIYNDMINWAISRFQVGKYVASEYANAVILRRAIGHDIQRIRDEISMQNESLIRPILSKSAKLGIVQNITSEILKNTAQKEIEQVKVIDKLIQTEGFTEQDAKETVEKALSIGALTMTRPGYLSV